MMLTEDLHVQPGDMGLIHTPAANAILAGGLLPALVANCLAPGHHISTQYQALNCACAGWPRSSPGQLRHPVHCLATHVLAPVQPAGQRAACLAHESNDAILWQERSREQA